MVRRILLLSAACAIMPLAAGCNGSSEPPASGAPGEVTSAPSVDLGTALYAASPPESLPTPDSIEQSVVIPNAVIRMDKKQIVSAEVDGRVEIVGTILPPGTQIDPNDKDIYYDPNDPNRQLPYKRLRVGDRVSAGQTVALLNDLDTLVQIETAQMIIIHSDQAIAQATEAESKIQESLQKLRDGGGSPLEVLNAEATLARYRENIYTSHREKAKAEGEKKRAELLRSKHRSNSAVTGVITNIMKEPGEQTRAGEPIMEILSLEDVRVEGNMEAHYADVVKPGMLVHIEPTMPVGPNYGIGFIAHRKAVTSVAVTSHPNRPMVVSASLDGTATVWDVMAAPGKPKLQMRLEHPVGVRSVATTGPRAGSRQLVATGGDDGRVRIWDVTNPEGTNTSKPTTELPESLPTAVTALCFTPDGRYLAAAAGRSVHLWDVSAGKKLYALPGEHKDAVTTVQFTPQCRLVTASRDKTIRVWNVGERAASVERAIDHRRGNVDRLGVSNGGGRVLFDQDNGRIEVLSMADGQPVGTIENLAAGTRFAVLAEFSSDDSYVLTAGGEGDMRGELQVWATPKSGGRGAEIRRLVTENRSMPTAAAFGPGFVAVGTEAGRVHIWTREQLEAASRDRIGRVVSVIRSDARNVRVRVETSAVSGERGLMEDKSTATMIVHPSQTVTPGAMPPVAAPGVGGVPMPNVVIPAGGAVPPVVKLPN